MQYREIGDSGITASVIGIGAYPMGGWRWGGTIASKAIEAVHAAIDSGINWIDTAPLYGMGLSEEIIGKAIKGRRDKIVLATKCGFIWYKPHGTAFLHQRSMPVYRCLATDSIEYELNQSLHRLNTDYIDLYQIHCPDERTSVEETMDCLLELQQKGKIRAIGLINTDHKTLEEYLGCGYAASLQVRYNMLDREIDPELYSCCRDYEMSMVACSPLAKGLLSGKILPEKKYSSEDARSHNPRFTAPSRAKANTLLQKFAGIAADHNITLTQLVLAWTLSQPGITHTLAGTQRAAQAAENAAAGDIRLTPSDLELIRKELFYFEL